MTERSHTAEFGPETWVDGDRGQLSPHATSKAKLENVRVYPDGSLGPRHAWDEVATDFSGQHEDSSMLPVTYDLGYNSFGPEGILVLDGGIPSFYNLDGGDEYAEGNNPVTALPPGYSFSTAHDYIFLVNEWLFDMRGAVTLPRFFSVTDVTDAITARFLTGLNEATCRGSAIHDGRAFYFGGIFTGVGGGGGEETIYYSDPFEYGTFTSSTQFFKIDGSIGGLISVGSNLFIWTSAGEWYVLQGRGDPAKGTLSKLGGGRIPPTGRTPGILDNVGLYIDSSGVSLSRITADGNLDDKGLAFLGDAVEAEGMATADLTNYYPTDSQRNLALIPISEGSHRSLYNGVWTTDRVSLPLEGAYLDRFTRLCIHPSSNQETMFRYNTATAERWTMYTRPIETYEIPNNFSKTESPVSILTLPRIVHPDKHVRVTRVVVDYYSNSTQSGAPSLVVRSASTNFVNSDLSASTGSHQIDANVAPLPFAPHAEVRLTFENIAIHRVRVMYETSDRTNV